MADYKGVVLTQKGRQLLAKAQAGAELRFTQVKIGDGETTDALEALTDLTNPKLSLPITHLQAKSDGTCHIRTNITNEGLVQGFFVKEVGLFAYDETGAEVLYAVTTATNPDYIPPDGSSTVINNQFDINILVGNAANIQADVNPLGLVNQADFDDHIQKTDDVAHPEVVRLIDDRLAPQANDGTLSQLLDWYAHQLRAVIGKEQWHHAPVSSIEELDRTMKKLSLQLEVDGRAPGSSGSFVDVLSGKPSRMTYENALADLTSAVSAGATTLPIDVESGTFKLNTLVTIEDDVNREEVFINSVGSNSLTVSALTKGYKKGARVARSTVVVDTINQEMRVGDWGTYSVSFSEVN
jgi:hypothetical protein